MFTGCCSWPTLHTFSSPGLHHVATYPPSVRPREHRLPDHVRHPGAHGSETGHAEGALDGTTFTNSSYAVNSTRQPRSRAAWPNQSSSSSSRKMPRFVYQNRKLSDFLSQNLNLSLHSKAEYGYTSDKNLRNFAARLKSGYNFHFSKL